MRRFFITALFLSGLLSTLPASADTFSSTNFQALDPVINFPGGYSSSGSFRLLGAIGQPAAGISDSGSFQVKGGFLYFPAETAAPTPAPPPAPTPTGGGPILEIFKKILGEIIALVTPCSGGDFNCDGRVNISDAGIIFYWWDKDITQPQFANLLTSFHGRKRSSPDLNKDNKVDIYDLSILLTRWTG